jgi:serine/threonine protein kinase
MRSYTIHHYAQVIETNPFIVTEYLHNGALSSVLHTHKEKPLPWTLRIKLCLDAATGLEFLHDVIHCVHRDVKR